MLGICVLKLLRLFSDRRQSSCQDGCKVEEESRGYLPVGDRADGWLMRLLVIVKCKDEKGLGEGEGVHVVVDDGCEVQVNGG